MRIYGCIRNSGGGLHSACSTLEPRVLLNIHLVQKREVGKNVSHARTHRLNHIGGYTQGNLTLVADDRLHHLADDLNDQLPVANLVHTLPERLHHNIAHLFLYRSHECGGFVGKF